MERMDPLWLIKAAAMGVVDGLTEFLPTSSTRRLRLAGSLRGLVDAKARVFERAIPTGPILAVIIVYGQRVHDTVAGLQAPWQVPRFASNALLTAPTGRVDWTGG